MKDKREPSIWVAEDDPDDQFLLAEAFKMYHFEGSLQFANNGAELTGWANELTSLDMLNKSPDLILLDLNMPLKNGCEVLRELKSHPELSKVPVVVLSTCDNESQMKRCHQSGANAYIKKPADFKALLSLVTVLYKYLDYRQPERV